MKKRKRWPLASRHPHYNVKRHMRLIRKLKESYLRMVEKGLMDAKDIPTEAQLATEAAGLMR